VNTVVDGRKIKGEEAGMKVKKEALEGDRFRNSDRKKWNIRQ
jgi:hypothetical protein